MNSRPAAAGLRSLPASSRHVEPWANGRGQTELLLREPDHAQWRLRISIAKVDCDGPFSVLPGTQRLLAPLDAPMELRFPDGRVQRANRLGILHFDGEQAPFGILPEGPTRDFNLMLRGGARADLFARTLVDSLVLLAEGDVRWLVYANRGQARIAHGKACLVLDADEAALIESAADRVQRTVIEGGGEIALVKLYA